MGDHRSYKRDDLGDSAHETGPSLSQLRAEERRTRRTYDQRFRSPLEGPGGFQDQQFRKLRIWNRYPRAWVWGFSFVCVSIFYSKPLYDAFIRESTEKEKARDAFLNAKMKEKLEKKGYGWLYDWL